MPSDQAALAANNRYEGKPLLRLAELYVLHCIDRLSESDERQIEALEPKLSALYKLVGKWHQVIESVLQFPSDTRSSLKLMWLQNQEIAKSNGVELSAQQFAEMFVDENVPN